jgi:hypothetical protein
MRVLLINPEYPIAETPSPPLALAGLKQRVGVPDGAGYGPSQLEKTLDFAFSQGYLDLASDAGTIRWRRVETLPDK